MVMLCWSYPGRYLSRVNSDYVRLVGYILWGTGVPNLVMLAIPGHIQRVYV